VKASGRPSPDGMQTSTKKLAMRTQAHEPQSLIVRLFVDEQQVGFEMALAVIGIFTSQKMIMECFWQDLVRSQQRNGCE